MKKKILLVGFTGGVGGVETFIMNIIKYIDYERFDVECLIHEDIDRTYIEDLKKIKIHKICGVKKNPIRFLKEIIEFYKNNKYDVVHLNQCTSIFFIYTFPVLFNRKIKFIVHSHNGSGKHKFLHKLISFIQNRRADLKLSCSDVAGKWMFGKSDYELINNGIDLKKYQYNIETKIKLSKALNIDGKVIIGSVARFDKQKNHKKIISVFKEYNHLNPNSVLILVGEGAEKDNILKLINEYDLTSSVLLLGIRNDVNDLLKTFDLLLMPSLYEGLPFIMVEAQAASLPILASNTISKQIEITDLIYKKNIDDSDKKWAIKIDEIIKNKNRLEKDYSLAIKKNGFDLYDTIEKIMNYYDN